ncbi:hypothetical protein D6833_06590, partial [Candidatus Parcubacteria bacterium]
QVPPDFLIDGRIAVEVRRLNENMRVGSQIKGLEKDAFGLRRQIERVRKKEKYRLKEPGPGWWMTYTFKRPIPSARFVARKLGEFFNELVGNPNLQRRTCSIYDSIDLTVFPRHLADPFLFSVAGWSDDDGGGLLAQRLQHNIQFCIDQKTERIQHRGSVYPKWWLVLVDHVAYGFYHFSLDDLRSSLYMPDIWHQIRIVDSQDPSNYFDL